MRVTSTNHQDENVDGNQVDEEHVASPRRDHVEVGQGAEGRPVDGPSLDALDPQVVGEEHAEDGDTFVIVGAGHGTRDVSGHDGNHRGRNQACTRRVELWNRMRFNLSLTEISIF